MTGLLWDMLRERRTAALITLLLTLAAAAAATGGPVYHEAAAQALRVAQVGDAPVTERVITGARLVDEDELKGTRSPQLPYVPGLRTVTGLQVVGKALVQPAGAADPVKADAWLVSRGGACRELVVTGGRCAVADDEVVVRDDLAARLGLKPGATVEFSPGDRQEQRMPLAVVGTFAPPPSNDPYWAGRASLLGGESSPMFTTERTVLRMDGLVTRTVDLIAPAAAYADPDQLIAGLNQARVELTAGNFVTITDIPALMARIAQGQDLLADSVTVAALPLVLLCWFVLFLVVAAAVEGRSEELGLTALRGTPWRLRWSLPFAEVALPVLAAAGPGLLLGYYGTKAVLAAAMPQAEVTLGTRSLQYAAVAVVGALLAGAFAQVGALRTPVLGLLRRLRAPRRAGAAAAVEVAVGALAALAGYQASVAGSAGGLGLLAPVCFGLGLGLVAARVLPAQAVRLARACLRRGRLRTSLGAFAIARVPGAARLVVLITVAFGLLGFVLTAYDTSGRAWAERARVQTGAAQVVTVQDTTAPLLMAAVAEVDPRGDFAMAVSRYRNSGMQLIMAVDSPRLPNVANWPQDAAVGAAEAARLLRPAEPDPMLVRASTLDVDVTVASPDPELAVQVRLVLITADALRRVEVRFSQVRPGRHRLTMPTEGCGQAPCRIDELSVVPERTGQTRFTVTVGTLRDQAGQVVLSADELSRLDRWVQAEPSSARPVAKLARTPDGLSMTADGAVLPDTRVTAAVIKGPVPLVVTQPLTVPEFTGTGGLEVPVAAVARTSSVPRYGTYGALIDLGYVDQMLGRGVTLSGTEVWLSAGAPPDAVERLNEAGLTVLGHYTVGQRRDQISVAPRLGLWFGLAVSAISVLLAAAGLAALATFERPGGDSGLSVLSLQGVRTRTLRAVATGSRCALALVAMATGLVAAAAAWALARDVLPVFSDGDPSFPAPALPRPGAVAGPVAAAAAVLLVGCWIATHLVRAQSEGADQ
ncbi:hypothetical protein Cs7R123_21920 [Catellatospora sp. TT07R-123]|uniref:hypothetical protein n=1 Tax=Catellatospora sp. TT07R-123 TaxID=2733863 RepID=UPI001B2A6F7F|nr:hypothetical protein [Catellatospora sp. TT07R-123]GHJ44850.1 hypothetical protein Cs7R123_21920 [Catellatospora sp. TT07R-123]